MTISFGPKPSKSVFLHSGWLCSSCDHITQVFGPFLKPVQCPTCGAMDTLTAQWSHQVTETVEVQDFGLKP